MQAWGWGFLAAVFFNPCRHTEHHPCGIDEEAGAQGGAPLALQHVALNSESQGLNSDLQRQSP